MTVEELLEDIRAAGQRAANQMLADYKNNDAVQFWRGSMSMAESILVGAEQKMNPQSDRAQSVGMAAKTPLRAVEDEPEHG